MPATLQSLPLGSGPLRRSRRQIANPEIPESHVALPTRVQLQRDAAVRRFGAGVGEVDHLHAVETGDVAVAFYLEQVLVPVALAHDGLVFRCGPYDPVAAVAVDAGRVLHDRAVHLELQALGDV